MACEGARHLEAIDSPSAVAVKDGGLSCRPVALATSPTRSLAAEKS